MKRHDGPEPADRDRWLDDELEPAEASAFERRLERDPALAAEHERQRAIDAALCRRFEAPAGAGTLPLHTGRPGRTGRTAAPPAGRRGSGFPRAASLAAGLVAAVGALAAFVALREREPVVQPLESVALAPTGPSFPITLLAAVEEPDLASLYDEVAAVRPPLSSCALPQELDGVERTLADRYGEELRLSSDAMGVLHGPYRSNEWPTGTVLASYPDGPGSQPVILIAERDDYYDCCMRPNLSVASHLHTFTWRVGATFLTEVTPKDEPRLLQYFEEPASGVTRGR
jgi:hypothetical protein